MDMNTLTDRYTVSGQIAPQDMAALRAAGFTMVICNRPDSEVTAAEDHEAMRGAAEAEGLAFVYNPVAGSGMTADNVAAQGEAVAAATGPVFAYCRSGTRSTFVWAMSQAGRVPAEELIAAAARGGYSIEPLRPQLEAAERR
ncbi:TIGR01244 family sulfur transferase [Oceaniglobus roseus]|uniref:TIGR01244 family sulfur transferase n=1 Tax=Oceaniglobus roseus TaxID=1737570 RepID=UPI000C7F2793|nr:TIGR01244 family sulfur transferase [Kandeliimicrobium roseum]